MKAQIRWNGGEMLTTIQGQEGCSVDCSYTPGRQMRYWGDEPDEPEFDIIRAYGPDGTESKELLHSIDDDEAERIRGEYIEWNKGIWI